MAFCVRPMVAFFGRPVEARGPRQAVRRQGEPSIRAYGAPRASGEASGAGGGDKLCGASMGTLRKVGRNAPTGLLGALAGQRWPPRTVWREATGPARGFRLLKLTMSWHHPDLYLVLGLLTGLAAFLAIPYEGMRKFRRRP